MRQTLYLLLREQKEISKMNILNEYINEYIKDFPRSNQFALRKRCFSTSYVTFQGIALCGSSVCGLVSTSLQAGGPPTLEPPFSIVNTHACAISTQSWEFDYPLHSDDSKIYIPPVPSPNILSST